MPFLELQNKRNPSSKANCVLRIGLISSECYDRVAFQCVQAPPCAKMQEEACDWYEDLCMDAKAAQFQHTSYGPQVAELTVPPLTLPHGTAIQHGQTLHPCHHLQTQSNLEQLFMRQQRTFQTTV